MSNEIKRWFSSVEDDIRHSYETALESHQSKDIQRSGHQGEATWFEVLRRWLPPHYDVGLRKYIVGSREDLKPFETDIVVFDPTYPAPLRERSTVLAAGVAAAFSVKLSVKKQTIHEEVARSARIADFAPGNARNVVGVVYPEIVTGILAHKGQAGVDDRQGLLETVAAASEGIDHPRKLVDLVCVADVATIACKRHPALANTITFDPVRLHGRKVQTHFQPSYQTAGFGAVAYFIVELYEALGRRDERMRRLARQLRAVTSGPAGEQVGHSRDWPMESVYSEQFLEDNHALLYEGQMIMDYWD